MKETNKWQIAQVVVAVILLMLNVYQYIEGKAKDEFGQMWQKKAIQALVQLSGAEAVISQLRDDIEGYDFNLEKYMTLAKENGKLADKYYTESIHFKMQRDELAEKLKNPPTLDLSNDAHVTFFLKWSGE